MSDQDLFSRLDTIETLLRQLLVQQPPTGRVAMPPVVGIRAEIAQVRAAGGDLTEYFRAKARTQTKTSKKEAKR